MKKIILTIAALCGFFIAHNSWATCSNYTAYTNGQILTHTSLNNLQTNYTNCINDILNGDTFTGSIAMHSGSDLNIYSDTGTTLKFTVDGATGDFGIPSTRKFYLDGTALTGDTYIYEISGNSMGLVAGGVTATLNATQLDIGSARDLVVTATKKLYLDGGGDTYINESAANTISFFQGGNERLKILTGTANIQLLADTSIAAASKFYLDGGGDTYIYESSPNIINLTANGSSILQLRQAYSQFVTGAVYIDDLITNTTASAANVFVNAASGQLQRSTSSRKYKTNIQNLEVDSSLIYQLRPVSYDDKREVSIDGTEVNGSLFHKRRYLGLIAEEVYPIIPNLVDINTVTGEPESVFYDRITVLLLAELKKLKAQNDDLATRVQALEAAH